MRASLNILDVIGLAILLALVVIYFVTIAKEVRHYAKIDLKRKEK